MKTLLIQVQARATTRLKCRRGHSRFTNSHTPKTISICAPVVGVNAIPRPNITLRATYSGGCELRNSGFTSRARKAASHRETGEKRRFDIVCELQQVTPEQSFADRRGLGGPGAEHIRHYSKAGRRELQASPGRNDACTPRGDALRSGAGMPLSPPRLRRGQRCVSPPRAPAPDAHGTLRRNPELSEALASGPVRMSLVSLAEVLLTTSRSFRLSSLR